MFWASHKRCGSSVRMSVDQCREKAIQSKASALKARQERIEEFLRDHAAEWNCSIFHRLARFCGAKDWTPELVRQRYEGGDLGLADSIEWGCFVKESYSQQVESAERLLNLCKHSGDGLVLVSEEDARYFA